ncbi:peptidoglycan DD-metalloendopeptidase family protein [Roseateles amylovorans]|uniref:Peptidoglycan DD-metalloendopeptidase family protein n=1 Tax=Roseateles amylovorans TaxID=2978473 RepID=A0ABY6AVV9_9BURK|nr:peptidoglycan DD-metalloendopeptidase family protein [Roseateles amylovorans]UXH76453.1 peptidoglycan DD-metalloendopeptidase family protein [Roseateles amylovorans]
MQQLLRLPLLWSSVLAMALVGCAGPAHRAPVEERSVGGRPAPVVSTTPPPSPAAELPKPLPGAENAGKPGYYSVKPGDTLIRIALDNGQSWRDVARWNGMDNPNLIEVGQVLRVVPPGVDPTAVTTRPLTSTKVEARPLDGKAPIASGTPASGASAPAVTAAPASTPAPATVPALPRDDDDITWGWPASGSVIAGFDEVRNKGLAFSGKPGDPVFAAADGRVMYAGAGLRGYGNMIIIKHSTNYLTAYAHNQTLLVKEDQVVRKGQKIAEMGSTDADQTKLHFEVRKQGKPIDPAKLLPAR